MNSMSVSIPPRMANLRLDPRGYPIPFIVYIDKARNAQFTINDHRKTELARQMDLCGICGTKLFRGRWFVGGPVSALHDRGAYYDGPLHEECAHYALQVCPWLAAPKYARRVETKRLKPENRDDAILFHDPTQTATRPSVFVAVMAIGHKITSSGLHFRPNRPYRKIEFWLNGRQIQSDEGMALAAIDIERIVNETEKEKGPPS